MNETEKNLTKPFELEQAKFGHTKLVHLTHSFPAVYILYFEGCGMFYIGSTRDLYVRVNLHRSELKLGKHHNRKMQKAYDCHENKNIRVSFIKFEDRKIGFQLEQKLIDQFMPSGKLFNISPDALVGGKGVVRTDETRELIRLRNKEQFDNPEARQRHSEITKKMWEDPQLRVKRTEALRQGRENSSFDYDKMRKEIWKNPGSRKKLLAACELRRKKVSINGTIYDSIEIAAQALGLTRSCVAHRLRSKFNKQYFFLKSEESK